MGSVDQVDDRTFRVDFTGEGAEMLKDRVNDKLKEFMGDYTDETLVEYVIVLLKNGRRKEEARNELNVFLGDDTDSFVSWLWNHLATNIDLYVQPEECVDDEVIKSKSSSVEKLERSDSHKLDSEADRAKPSRESKIRHNREWKGLVRDASDPPPLRSSEIENIHLDEKSHQRIRRTRRSRSPRPASQRKRSRADDRQNAKSEATQVNTGATRRLLQFAVRDAVGTSRPSSNTTTEPSLKRLRSVVSTPTGDSILVDHLPRIKSVARVANPMASVIKAVAEAAEDAVKVKSSGSVFDRLGRGLGVSRSHDPPGSHIEATTGDGEDVHDNQLHMQKRSTYLQSDHSGRYASNMTMLGNNASDSTHENERYGYVNAVFPNGLDVSQPGTSGGNKDEDLIMVDRSVSQNSGNLLRLKRNRDQGQPAVASNTSQKIVNISVNANTWKPPNYQEPMEVAGKPVQESGTRVVRDNNHNLTVNGNKKPVADSQTELQKTVPPATGHVAGRPLEDADSRTLFVSNVHFAATKDSLSRHFNKFGDVLKVLIVTDAATGQPIGSAYVEFMRKEAADNALSLDGTSFMSRLLKVIKRSAAHQETATAMTWPRMARATPYSTSRFPRASYPISRGMAGSFRGRPLGKPGGRSFQWKRDAQPSSGESGAPLSGNPIPSPTTRSLTYVRTEPKPEAKAGTA